jgi:hypothetical protein
LSRKLNRASFARQGSCSGANNTVGGGNDYTSGRWYFTVNGEPYPTIRMTEPDGEVWRLTNASGNASYDLHLINDAEMLKDHFIKKFGPATDAGATNFVRINTGASSSISSCDCPGWRRTSPRLLSMAGNRHSSTP